MNYLAFLRGEEKDDRGRFIDKILSYSDFWLEHRHDYIQRVFPSNISSTHDTRIAPPTYQELHLISEDKKAISNVSRMYHRMLLFYHLQDEEYKNPDIIRKWNHFENHNHLRISRILQCLKLLNMYSEYQDFCMRLTYCMQHDWYKISPNAKAIWKTIMGIKEKEDKKDT